MLPQVARVLCVWFPKESHRYSRRLPAFYVFGSLERVIDTLAGFPRFMYCQLSDNGQRGHLPRVYTDLHVLIRTWVTLSLAVFRALFTEISRSFPEF